MPEAHISMKNHFRPSEHHFSLQIAKNHNLNATNLLFMKALMQGKLFQKCTHFLYSSVLSLGGKVNTRRMSPDMETIFTKIIYETIM